MHQIELFSRDPARELEKALRATFTADPESGQVRYRRNHGQHLAGQVAGTIAGRGYRDGGGYLQLHIFGRDLYVHRVLWFLVFGAWPPCELDHVNRIRTDDRLTNLRLASRGQNAVNSPARNASGLKGIHQTATGRYRARVRYHHHTWSQTFDQVEDAIAWRNDLARRIWGKHAILAMLPERAAVPNTAPPGQ